MKLARVLAILSFFIISFTGTHALAQGFAAGDKIISLGASVQPDIKISGAKSEKIPPVSLSLEYIAFEQLMLEKLSLGFGVQAGYFSYATPAPNTYQVGEIAAFVNLHYSLGDRLSVYAGAMPGYYFDKYNENIVGFSGYQGLHKEIYGGLAWYFTRNIGAFAQASTGLSFVKAGITFRM